MSLEGKVAIITGASQGIGRECALVLAESGADIALGARNFEKLTAVAGEIEALGRKAMPLALDVSSEETIRQTIGKVQDTWGKIDILVNNAGITRDNLLMRMKPADWEAVIRTNLEGAYHCMRLVLPGMVRRRAGRIINITSVVAQTGNAGQANYIASKAGLIGLTKAVAAEVASRSITVNAVSPGFVDTAMTQALPDAVKQKILSVVPMGRMATPREIALAVRFLASDDAAYITGHVLNVNGGMFMA